MYDKEQAVVGVVSFPTNGRSFGRPAWNMEQVSLSNFPIQRYNLHQYKGSTQLPNVRSFMNPGKKRKQSRERSKDKFSRGSAVSKEERGLRFHAAGPPLPPKPAGG